MIQSAAKIEWNKFAEKIGGKTSFAPAERFRTDNTFQIGTAREEIKLVWADEPETNKGAYVNAKTFFYYNLGQSLKREITIYKKDLLSRLFTIFNKGRIKTGDAELDRQYLFISGDKVLLSKCYNDFKVFSDRNKFKDFVIETKLIEKDNFLVIQVNDLLTDEKNLTAFYNIGLSISKILQES